ncbi:DinB family protein [Mucilaginibacter sp. dw_454]|uniref:DinB family protein n=1 Tax=Mucilaginibacter sp. dw_454 TaxID=2720079 RepID=UPI001BD34B76|nr:DinB family protein [Mucilaginibacter sp. dw_454]
MKDYFLRMFGYDLYANQEMLTAIRGLNNPEKPVQLLGHLLAAQQRWLRRCKNESDADVIIFPKTETVRFEELIAANNREWVAFLNGLTEEDMNRAITYQTSNGAPFTNTITEVVTQVINHGTHHRAQIGQQLKYAGMETLPLIDYIFYIRQ